MSDYDDKVHALARSLGPPSPSDWFSIHLFRLMLRSDLANAELLRLGFPGHLEVLERWRAGELPQVETLR